MHKSAKRLRAWSVIIGLLAVSIVDLGNSHHTFCGTLEDIDPYGDIYMNNQWYVSSMPTAQLKPLVITDSYCAAISNVDNTIYAMYPYR